MVSNSTRLANQDLICSEVPRCHPAPPRDLYRFRVDDLEKRASAERSVQRAREILGQFNLTDADAFLAVVRRAMTELEHAETLLAAHRKRVARGRGARKRILEYFLEKGVGTPVSGQELRRISGIQEWARRVRELRVEEGWDIRHGGVNYQLMSPVPDRAVAEAWKTANSIRREKGLSAREKILKYLQANVGQTVTSEMLNYVSGIQEHGRRVRELRTELGYAISTQIDRPELKPGEYVLESVQPTLDVNERRVTEELRRQVFEREGYECAICGKSAGPGVLLTAHHLVPKIEGGSDTDPENFVTLCHKDHATVTGEQQRELLRKRRAAGSP